MKQGRTLQELAVELNRQQATKRDFVSDTRNIRVETTTEGGQMQPVVTVPVRGGREGFFIKRFALQQMSSWAKIPMVYAERMAADAPDLLATNLNHWMQNNPAQRMVRTLDGFARAFLSNRYRRIDNIEIAAAALPTIHGLEGLTVETAEITETRMYIKAITSRIQRDVSVGDPVQAGIIISNSEIGAGSVNVAPLVFRLICANGMIVNSLGSRKYHVGRAIEGTDDEVSELYRDETLAADDKALMLRVQDTVRGALSETGFDTVVESFREAQGMKIGGDIPQVIELTAKKFSLNDDETQGFMRHLIQGGDLSKYGMVNAMTRVAQDVPSFDRSVELERAGGAILDLPKSEWEVISTARVKRKAA